MLPVEICILAGGLSTRMGRDKSRMRLEGKTLLKHVQLLANATGCPVRVIRRDLVARCGPLGGIYTGLKTTGAEAVLFLACDMPFVSGEILQRLIRGLTSKTVAVFVKNDGWAGFPFILRPAALGHVEAQLASGPCSLQALAGRCRARLIAPPRGQANLLFNCNTPADWESARRIVREKRKFP
jgi:molybdenum cofactor guanylyltransferase